MREPPKIAVIVNPAAHKGGAGKRWPAIQAELVRRLGPFEPLLTQAPGHATYLARSALAQGTRRFVAVGGDGTVNETLNGLLEPSGRLSEPDAVLCPVPAGTANELCRALGHLDHPARAFDAAMGGGTRAIDLLRVRWLITLVVDDYDEAITYFTGKLGFALVDDTALGGGKCWVAIAGT
ncbi:MAG TPA: diacylglycerol kinase family protein [Reyranella sp.]|jgi:diacylglycerol kinase family enzyme|nr:diacylglycerol kinase family protein [Reyranella sp.]